MDKNEETISLTKCDNSILADEIVSKLANAGIASSLHDELNDPAYGAYGPNPGIEVRVFKKDLERAQSILKEITEKREKQLPWCPNCGSQNVVALGKVRTKLSKWAVIIGVLLVVIGIVCIILPFCVKSLESATVSFLIISLISLAVGVVLVIPQRERKNYKCNECGTEFYKE